MGAPVIRHRDPGDESDYWERVPDGQLVPPGMVVEVARPYRLRLQRGRFPTIPLRIDDPDDSHLTLAIAAHAPTALA